MTDSTGLIQHAHHSVPNRRFGYTTDDNARALIVAIKQYAVTGQREDLDLAIKYLSFMHYAHSSNHKFRNVMDYEHRFLDDEGTQDCYGRSIWACGYAASSCLPRNVRIVARKLFDDSIVWLGDLDSPRARMYSVLGICEYLRENEDNAGLKAKVSAIADSLVTAIRTYSDSKWLWYEPYMTYGNAILPLGMLSAAELTGHKRHMDAALSTIRFLTDVLIINRRLEIIGNNGWYENGRERAWFDQQSVDAGYIVYLYTQANKILGDKSYIDLARIANSWFFGNNRSGVVVYDSESGGCYDAVTEAGLNLNQGAESCVCYLLAQHAIQETIEAPRPLPLVEQCAMRES
jgi:hypothetical protein